MCNYSNNILYINVHTHDWAFKINHASTIKLHLVIVLSLILNSVFSFRRLSIKFCINGKGFLQLAQTDYELRSSKSDDLYATTYIHVVN